MFFEPLEFHNGTFIISPPPSNLTLTPRPSLLPFISDGHLALLLPVVCYWTYSLFFHYLDTHDLFFKYRIHTPQELEKKNRCSVREVVRAVVVQHLIQTVVGLAVDYVEGQEMCGMEDYELWQIQYIFARCCGLSPAFNDPKTTSAAASKFPHGSNNGPLSKLQPLFPILAPLIQLLGLSTRKLTPFFARSVYYFFIPFTKIFIAFLIIDSWQYTLHRYMHNNKFLYRHMHSVHHRLYVPYAFGALYNSLLEGFLLDTVGTGVAQMVAKLSRRESIILYTFSTLKTVDDHCGYALPYDPFQKLFPNNAVYHDIHHQHFGIKTNFAQPFFTFWDKWCGTRYEKLEEYQKQQEVLRRERYKEYLEKKNK